MDISDVLNRLERLANPSAAEGMTRYGITAAKIYGISIPSLRSLAEEIGRDHPLSARLWRVNSRETRILASMTADPEAFEEDDAESWVRDFDSWEVCDQCCMNLLEKTSFAYRKAAEWSKREEEFVKRAGYVLMARLAVCDKGAADDVFEVFFPHIIRGSTDPRRMVKKGVNWALRQIGKRCLSLNAAAVRLAEEIHRLPESSAKWISSDALRELRSDAVRSRLKAKEETCG